MLPVFFPFSQILSSKVSVYGFFMTILCLPSFFILVPSPLILLAFKGKLKNGERSLSTSFSSLSYFLSIFSVCVLIFSFFLYSVSPSKIHLLLVVMIFSTSLVVGSVCPLDWSPLLFSFISSSITSSAFKRNEHKLWEDLRKIHRMQDTQNRRHAEWKTLALLFVSRNETTRQRLFSLSKKLFSPSSL